MATTAATAAPLPHPHAPVAPATDVTIPTPNCAAPGNHDDDNDRNDDDNNGGPSLRQRILDLRRLLHVMSSSSSSSTSPAALTPNATSNGVAPTNGVLPPLSIPQCTHRIHLARSLLSDLRDAIVRTRQVRLKRIDDAAQDAEDEHLALEYDRKVEEVERLRREHEEECRKEDTMLDGLRKQVGEVCAMAEAEVELRRRMRQSSSEDNADKDGGERRDLIQDIFFAESEDDEDDDEDGNGLGNHNAADGEAGGEEDDYSLGLEEDDDGDGGREEQQQQTTPTPRSPRAHSLSHDKDEERQRLQAQLLEDEIAEMAAQLKASTEKMNTTLQTQNKDLNEMEVLAEDNVEKVTDVTGRVTDHVSKGWKRSFATWTLLISVLATFTFLFMTMRVVPKRRDACLFFCGSRRGTAGRYDRREEDRLDRHADEKRVGDRRVDGQRDDDVMGETAESRDGDDNVRPPATGTEERTATTTCETLADGTVRCSSGGTSGGEDTDTSASDRGGEAANDGDDGDVDSWGEGIIPSADRVKEEEVMPTADSVKEGVDATPTQDPDNKEQAEEKAAEEEREDEQRAAEARRREARAEERRRKAERKAATDARVKAQKDAEAEADKMQAEYFRSQAVASQKARAEAEAKKRERDEALRLEEEKAAKEEEDRLQEGRRRAVAEEAEKARLAEEKATREKEQEAKRRQAEAEKAEKARLAEEKAKEEAEEEEAKMRAEAEETEKARLAEERATREKEQEAKRRQAEAEEAEKARLAEEKAREEAEEEAAKKRAEAQEAEKARLADEKAREEEAKRRKKELDRVSKEEEKRKTEKEAQLQEARRRAAERKKGQERAATDDKEAGRNDANAESSDTATARDAAKHITSDDVHWASAKGEADDLSAYARLRPDLIDVPDGNGWRPIHEAARGGQFDSVRVLLEAGADATARTGSDERGGDALWWLAQTHGMDHPAVALLQENGAKGVGPERARPEL